MNLLQVTSFFLSFGRQTWIRAKHKTKHIFHMLRVTFHHSEVSFSRSCFLYFFFFRVERKKSWNTDLRFRLHIRKSSSLLSSYFVRTNAKAVRRDVKRSPKACIMKVTQSLKHNSKKTSESEESQAKRSRSRAESQSNVSSLPCVSHSTFKTSFLVYIMLHIFIIHKVTSYFEWYEKKNFTIKHCVYWKRNWKNTFTNLVFLIQYFLLYNRVNVYSFDSFRFEKLQLSLAAIHLNFSIAECRKSCNIETSQLLNIAQTQRASLRGLREAFFILSQRKNASDICAS